MADPADLVRLRPGMPLAALSGLVGADWAPPDAGDLGFVRLKELEGFSARIDGEGRIGSISLHGAFPPSLSLEGLHLGMPFGAARRAYPGLMDDPDGGSEGIAAFVATLPGGDELRIRFRDGTLLGLDLVRPGLAYPGPPPPKLYPRTAGAYDIEILPHSAAPAGPGHGWCFGLPPGIAPVQWPRDPRTGQPLRHAFTLLLPPDHRVAGHARGPGLVAISLFATDHCGESVQQDRGVAAAWDSPRPPTDPALLPVWQHRQGRHPHECGMTDLLGEPYAVIWLTLAEFQGPPCPPPPEDGRLAAPSPAWTRIGAAAAFVGHDGPLRPDQRSGKNYVVRMIGGAPDQEVGFNRALRWTQRTDDPNAGLAPPEDWDGTTSAGYRSCWTTNAAGEAELAPWTLAHRPNHIGGTMRPVQSHPSPAFSPFYIEFEEYLGGFNFGSGCGQLDLESMRLDWACD